MVVGEPLGASLIVTQQAEAARVRHAIGRLPAQQLACRFADDASAK
jgi:hypothetical protein